MDAFRLFDAIEGKPSKSKSNLRNRRSSSSLSNNNNQAATATTTTTPMQSTHNTILPTYHPDILTSSLDLWWMGQRVQKQNKCEWGSSITFTDVPIAATIEMELELHRPMRTKGICRIDVEQLVQITHQIQKCPVSRIKRSTKNRELLGYVLFLLVENKTEFTKTNNGTSAKTSGISSDCSGNANGSNGKSSCRDRLRCLVYDFVIFSTFLMMVFGLLPYYVLGRFTFIDEYILIPYVYTGKYLWLPSFVNYTLTTTDVMFVVLLIIALLWRGLRSLCKEKNTAINIKKKTMNSKVVDTVNEVNGSGGQRKSSESAPSVLADVTLIPIGFERPMKITKARRKSSKGKKDHNRTVTSVPNVSIPYTTGNGGNVGDPVEVPLLLRKSVDEGILSFVRDCRDMNHNKNNAQWKGIGKKNGIDRYVSTRSAYPSSKSIGRIDAPLKSVFNVLTGRQGHNDPLSTFNQSNDGKDNYNDGDGDGDNALDEERKQNYNKISKYQMKATSRNILKQYDQHTKIEQVEYNMTTNTDTNTNAIDESATATTSSVVVPRRFIFVHHWRVISDTEKTVVILSFGTTLLDNNNNNNNKDTSDNFVRGEFYGGWMLHPINNGSSTVVTRVSILDMKMYTVQLEQRIKHGIHSEIETLKHQINKFNQNKDSQNIQSNNEQNNMYIENVPSHSRNSSNASNQNTKENTKTSRTPKKNTTVPISPLLISSNPYLRNATETLCKNFISTCSHPNKYWTFYLKENDIDLYKPTTPTNYAEAKGIGIINYPPAACLRMLKICSTQSTTKNNPYASKLDPDKVEGSVLHNLIPSKLTETSTNDCHLTLNYMRFKGVPFAVTSRDFVNLTHWRKLKNNTLITCATTASAELQSKYMPPNR